MVAGGLGSGGGGGGEETERERAKEREPLPWLTPPLQFQACGVNVLEGHVHRGGIAP